MVLYWILDCLSATVNAAGDPIKRANFAFDMIAAELGNEKLCALHLVVKVPYSADLSTIYPLFRKNFHKMLIFRGLARNC